MPETTLLEHILSPVSLDEFLEKYREQDYLFLQREAPDHFGDLFTLADVDSVLATLSTHSLSLLTVVPPPDSGRKTERLRAAEITAKELYEGFENGDTLVINRLQTYWPPLTRLAMDLESKLFCRVNANLYFTPADSQGFGVHIDDHDVFVLQVDGAKDWYLYESEESLPIEKIKIESGLSVPQPDWGDGEPPLRQKHTVAKGDFLYVPRGIPHKAVATPGHPSVHITVGIHPIVWMDALKIAVEAAALEDIEFRRGLPREFFADPEARDALAETFKGLLERLGEQDVFDRVHRLIRRKRLERPILPPDGHFAQLLRLQEIDADTRLEVRVGLNPRVEQEEKIARIHYADYSVQGPLPTINMLTYIAEHRSFVVSELPGPYDVKSNLVMVRRLVKEGLLRQVESSE